MKENTNASTTAPTKLNGPTQNKTVIGNNQHAE
jgi:hypothetical protein